MITRYEFLGEQFAKRFQDQSVVNFYHLRPAYPPETFAILNELIVDEPRAVLDVGCGTGNVARLLVNYTQQIDAVDISEAMLKRARTLPEGDSPRIRWLLGRAEEIELQPPYALITAGESLHWMNWDIILPRFARLLAGHGTLAILHIEEQAMPWRQGYTRIVKRYSNNPTYQALDLIAELENSHLFQKQGERSTAPVPLRQTIEEYTLAQHARSALSLDTMTPEQAAQFAQDMRALLLPYAQESSITVQVTARVVWGRPLDSQKQLQE